MATESEASYLAIHRQQNTCPTCHQRIEKKYGSGQFKDGVFCSQNCYAKWHAGMMRERHRARMKQEEKK